MDLRVASHSLLMSIICDKLEGKLRWIHRYLPGRMFSHGCSTKNASTHGWKAMPTRRLQKRSKWISFTFPHSNQLFSAGQGIDRFYCGKIGLKQAKGFE